MPTMSRPALDVKGGTSPMKEVTFAILQSETLEPERQPGQGRGHVVGPPGWGIWCPLADWRQQGFLGRE